MPFKWKKAIKALYKTKTIETKYSEIQPTLQEVLSEDVVFNPYYLLCVTKGEWETGYKVKIQVHNSLDLGIC
jgi:hypothetical protein